MDIQNSIPEDQMMVFEKFYMEYKDKIYSFLLNILNYNKDDASQILSDSFVKLREYMSQKRVDNMKYMIYTIAHNSAVNLIKKNKNTVYIQDDIVQYHTLLDEVNLNFEQKQIQNIIQEMDTTTREVIHLILYEEKSYEEVWKILKIPKNTVWTILFQAKNKLKKLHLSYLS